MGTKKYSEEFRTKAITMVMDHYSDYTSKWSATCSIATKVGVTPETLRKWVKQFEIDNGDKTGVTTAEQEEIKRLKKEVLKLQQTQEILLAASAFFAKTVLDGH